MLKNKAISLYLEWPHRQCVSLAFGRSYVRASIVAASLAICSPHLRRAILGAQGGTALPWPCNGQAIGSTVSDAIVRSWLWSTAIGSSTLVYFSSITTSS